MTNAETTQMTPTQTGHKMSEGFDPANYEIVDYLDNKRPVYMGGTAEGYAAEVKWFEETMQQVIGADWRKKCHHCAHCNNGNVRYITVAEFIPTGERVVFGCDCTERLHFANIDSLKIAMLKKRAEGRAETMRKWKARCAFMEANPGLAELVEQAKGEAHKKNNFAQDVIGKLDRFGSISVNQINALKTSLARDIEYAAKKAVEAMEPKGDAPNGVATVTGTVVSVKLQEDAYGTTVKMLLKLENNAKVWLTMPAGADANRGDVLTVKATFTAKADDKSFAFGKRPRLVAVVSRQTVA